MKTRKSTYRTTIVMVLATAFISVLVLVAMRVRDEVVWTGSDFAFAGILLIGAGLTYDVVAEKAGSPAYRAAVGLGLATVLLLLWISGAVGIIGSENHPGNLMYFGVLAVGLIGAFAARFRAGGMARALFATALAHALVAAIAIIGGMGAPASGALELLLLNGFFVALWVSSGLLFRRAAQGQTRRAAA